MGLKLTTLRSEVTCSTNWARQAPRDFFYKFTLLNVFHVRDAGKTTLNKVRSFFSPFGIRLLPTLQALVQVLDPPERLTYTIHFWPLDPYCLSLQFYSETISLCVFFPAINNKQAQANFVLPDVQFLVHNMGSMNICWTEKEKKKKKRKSSRSIFFSYKMETNGLFSTDFLRVLKKSPQDRDYYETLYRMKMNFTVRWFIFPLISKIWVNKNNKKMPIVLLVNVSSCRRSLTLETWCWQMTKLYVFIRNGSRNRVWDPAKCIPPECIPQKDLWGHDLCSLSLFTCS